MSPGVPTKPPHAPATPAMATRLVNGMASPFGDTRCFATCREEKCEICFSFTGNSIYLHLVDGESGGGVGELPHERGGEPVVERQDALVADNPCGLLDDADVLRLSCRLQVHLEQVQRVGAAGGARARQAAEVPPAHLLGGVLARHDF